MLLGLLLLVFLFLGVKSDCGIHPNKTLGKELHLPRNFELENTRLIGGVEMTPHKWPWLAQIMYNKRHRCGGALLKDRFILTAAHCFSRTGQNPNDYSVLLGGHESGSGTEYRVTNITLHSLYNIGVPNAYDVALLRIEPFVNQTVNINNICLPTLPAHENDLCVVAGWGIVEEKSTKESETLREIHIPVVSWIECAWKEQFRGRVHFPSMICAGMQEKLDSCQGDSGSPLMCASNGKWEVQGIVSWGFGCGRPGFPGIYSSVHSALPWIYSQMWIYENF